VIESFKGAGEQLEALRETRRTAAFTFRPAKSASIRVRRRGESSAAAALRARACSPVCASSRSPPRLRGHRAPPRPPALAAVERADPSPYEPLYGYDPDLALGVGPRASRARRGARRLAAPAQAPGVHRAGRRSEDLAHPGSVGGDSPRRDRLRDGELHRAPGAARRLAADPLRRPARLRGRWVHRCHLDAATPRLEYEPWEKLLAGGAALLPVESPRVLRKAPPTRPPAVANIPADPNLYGHPAAPVSAAIGRGCAFPCRRLIAPIPSRRASRVRGWVRWRGTSSVPRSGITRGVAKNEFRRLTIFAALDEGYCSFPEGDVARQILHTAIGATTMALRGNMLQARADALGDRLRRSRPCVRAQIDHAQHDGLFPSSLSTESSSAAGGLDGDLRSRSCRRAAAGRVAARLCLHRAA
jgi:hypothetical protein